MTRKELLPFSPDGKYGLNWGSNGIIGIVSFETGKEIGFLRENEPLRILRAAFSRDMRRILCRNSDGTVAAWSSPRETGARSLQNSIVQAALLGKDKFTMRRMRTWDPGDPL